jgi:hypothetical protein
MNSEPLAIIKITFDDLPNDIKLKVELFFSITCICLILLNILLCINILDIFYKKLIGTNTYTEIDTDW